MTSFFDFDSPGGDERWSRRRFLSAAAAYAGAGTLGSLRFASGQVPASRNPDRLYMPAGAPRSRVVQVREAHVLDAALLQDLLLREMLENALMSLTSRPDPAEAWQSLLQPEDLIGLKFNRSGQEALASTETLAPVIIQSIIDAGFEPRQLVCIEAPAAVERRFGTTPAAAGFDSKPTEFGSGADELASVVAQVTALIDVPFLKTHNIAGMTCALKNLSHGLVKHPARYHGNGCSPYIADIVARTPIRKKLRLCIVDALRVVYRDGPEPGLDNTLAAGTLILSQDPVATDVVGLSVLNDLRRRHRLNPVARSPGEITYLSQAHRLDAGVAVWHGIDLIRAGQ